MTDTTTTAENNDSQRAEEHSMRFSTDARRLRRGQSAERRRGEADPASKAYRTGSTGERGGKIGVERGAHAVAVVELPLPPDVGCWEFAPANAVNAL